MPLLSYNQATLLCKMSSSLQMSSGAYSYKISQRARSFQTIVVAEFAGCHPNLQNGAVIITRNTTMKQNGGM